MAESASFRLPIHGFVLAGGKSSRMGMDKATLRLRGKPMVELAVEKLRTFCAEVWIAGNRDDLSGYAPVVRETRTETGPAAGVEAGMLAGTEAWVLFAPVDVPLVPAELLRTWAAAVLDRSGTGCAVSFLVVNGDRQPAFCMLRTECSAAVSAAIEGGERRLAKILMSVGDEATGRLWVCEAARISKVAEPSDLEMERWFLNVNTPEELAKAEAWATDWAASSSGDVHHRDNLR